MVIINPNAPSVSNLGSNRADGQVESTQIDARQSQRARQPQVAQQPTATETATAARPSQGNNNIPLLNNRDQAVSSAIQRNNAEPVGREARADNDTATIQTAAINVAQAQAPAETLQRLADAAQARLEAPENAENARQTVAEQLVSDAPQAQQAQPQASPVEAPAVNVDVNIDVPAAPAPQAQQPVAPGATAFGADSAPAPVQEAPEFVPPAPAFQVLQNSQQRLNDILLPDFANFIGLRASIPAQTQAEQIVDNPQAANVQPVDVEV